MMLPYRFGIASYGLAVLLLCTAVSSQAQNPSLADIAKKEQERRKAAPTPQKIYTNKDLPPPPVAPTTPQPDGTTPGLATPVLEPAPVTPPPKPAGDQKDEAWWRARMTAAREELRRNEAFLEALQSRVNALSSDFVNRDDPYQRSKIGEDRQKALAEMDRVKREIEEGKKLIDGFEEEARKSGVPPGWLR